MEGGRRRPRRLRRTVQYDCHVNRVRIRNVGMLRDVIVVLYFYYYCGEIKKSERQWTRAAAAGSACSRQKQCCDIPCALEISVHYDTSQDV